ncbi:MAG: putative toxin-antitoxin system toxin component, PIN family [Bacteroidetes bacterium]|nr:putative toxin-antitoxin system toxin component, PIN family [Bacteroidota bacterium]MCL2329237.1 putative toxin-antitoxin system toxin component, PIN family [Bacteroidota bacterium]
MKIVLDTNCLVATVANKSDYRCILTALQQGFYKLYFSNDIFFEYEEVLTRFYSSQIVSNFLNFILYSPNAIQITPYFQWNLITADNDDNKFVDCALNAGADYIVTNDKHFNILNKIDFPSITVIDIDMFKDILLEKHL